MSNYAYVSEEDQPLVDLLNKLTKSNVTLQDYDDWIDGGDGYPRFDRAVKRLLKPYISRRTWNDLDNSVDYGLVKALEYALGIMDNLAPYDIDFMVKRKVPTLKQSIVNAVKKGYIDPLDPDVVSALI